MIKGKENASIYFEVLKVPSKFNRDKSKEYQDPKKKKDCFPQNRLTSTKVHGLTHWELPANLSKYNVDKIYERKMISVLQISKSESTIPQT